VKESGICCLVVTVMDRTCVVQVLLQIISKSATG